MVLSFSCRMGDFKTKTFEFENPRERVIRFFIGTNGINIKKIQQKLREVSLENMHGFFFWHHKFKNSIHKYGKFMVITNMYSTYKEFAEIFAIFMVQQFQEFGAQ